MFDSIWARNLTVNDVVFVVNTPTQHSNAMLGQKMAHKGKVTAIYQEHIVIDGTISVSLDTGVDINQPLDAPYHRTLLSTNYGANN